MARLARIDADWPAPANVTAFTTERPEPSLDILVSELGAGTRLQRLRQVHGTRAIAAPWPGGIPEADASHTREPGLALLVRTADCLPVLLCNRRGSEVAAIHAGWRGLAAGVIEATVGALTSAPGELLAWLGPAISARHFEVGTEVREAFLEQVADAGPCFSPGAPGKYQADLVALARLRLRSAGIEAIHGGHWCTYADARRFYSHRRDRDRGRLLSVICFR